VRIVDAHRILGPTPTGRARGSAEETLHDLDGLGIASAAVTPSWMLFGDPRSAAGYEAERGPDGDAGRLMTVPVVIPGPADSGWPQSVDEVRAPLVRVCPVKHRFDPSGPSAMRWWRDFADRGTAVAVDASECGLPLVAAIAASVPGLRILLLSPGYRELRRLTELLEAAPGLRVETGTIVSAGAIEWLAGTVGAHRLVFGTGAPIWDAAGPRFQLEHLDLAQHEIELIAHGSWDVLIGARS
jgi:hypothetical protein